MSPGPGKQDGLLWKIQKESEYEQLNDLNNKQLNDLITKKVSG